MTFRIAILRLAWGLVRQLLPCALLISVYQIPLFLFGTPEGESPMWELILERHAQQRLASNRLQLEQFGAVPTGLRDRSIPASQLAFDPGYFLNSWESWVKALIEMSSSAGESSKLTSYFE